MKRILLLTLLIMARDCWGQVQYPYILNPPTVAPSGSCAGPQIQVLGSSGAIYTCNNGTWAASGGGGTPPFALSTLTSGVIYKGNGASAIQPTQCDEGITNALTVTCGATDTGGVSAEVFTSIDTTHSSSWTGTYTGTDPTASVGAAQVRLEMHSTPASGQKQDLGQAPFPFFLEGATGAITAIVSGGQYGPHVLPRAAFLENITATAATFTCSGNPTFTLEDCGSSVGACSSPTALATVTLTTANTAVAGTVSVTAMPAGHYFVFKTTAGTCSVLDATVSALAHSGTE